MTNLQPVTLAGQHVRLVPLSLSHANGLAEAVADGCLWNSWYTVIPRPEGIPAEIARRIQLQQSGNMLPFAVESDGKLVGMTSFMDIDLQSPRVEIGSTWYRQSVHRTAVNTECKLLLLTHAFETLGCIAVELRTHVLNRASRRGIERIGAKLDGILRAHRVMPDGTVRDSCVYSITAPEWPTVRTHLRYELTRPRS